MPGALNIFLALDLTSFILVLTTIFVATNGDSMTYNVSMVMTDHYRPGAALRVFRVVMKVTLAAIPVSIGAGELAHEQGTLKQ